MLLSFKACGLPMSTISLKPMQLSTALFPLTRQRLLVCGVFPSITLPHRMSSSLVAHLRGRLQRLSSMVFQVLRMPNTTIATSTVILKTPTWTLPRCCLLTFAKTYKRLMMPISSMKPTLSSFPVRSLTMTNSLTQLRSPTRLHGYVLRAITGLCVGSSFGYFGLQQLVGTPLSFT